MSAACAADTVYANEEHQEKPPWGRRREAVALWLSRAPRWEQVCVCGVLVAVWMHVSEAIGQIPGP